MQTLQKFKLALSKHEKDCQNWICSQLFVHFPTCIYVEVPIRELPVTNTGIQFEICCDNWECSFITTIKSVIQVWEKSIHWQAWFDSCKTIELPTTSHTLLIPPRLWKICWVQMKPLRIHMNHIYCELWYLLTTEGIHTHVGYRAPNNQQCQKPWLSVPSLIHWLLILALTLSNPIMSPKDNRS